MIRSRWFLLAAVGTLVLASGSASAGLVVEVAQGGFTSVGGNFGHYADLLGSNGAPVAFASGNLLLGPGILPSTAVTVPDTTVTGTVSGAVALQSGAGVVAAAASMQYSLSGGPTTPGEPPFFSAATSLNYNIVDDPPSISQYFYVSLHGEITGYMAPGDSLSYFVNGHLGEGEFYSATETGTTSGSFVITIDTPEILFAYQNGAHIVDYNNDLNIATAVMYATITKGTTGATSYVDFDPSLNISITNSPIPEPSSWAMFATGTLVVAGIAFVRRRRINVIS
jgi:hypothetical protein